MKAFSFGLAAFVIAVCGLVSQSEAQIVTLTDNNSTAQINVGSSDGMFNWFVDGNDYLAQQWFWYRVGSVGPETPINTISAPNLSNPDPRVLFVTYSNTQFNVKVGYLLTGSSPGSGQSDMGESISIANTSGGTLDFHFFQYSDFDLGHDTVILSTNQFGLYNQVDQFNTNSTLSETVVTPGANLGAGALFPVTLNALNDGGATTLTNNFGAGPGDVTWALEWNLLIPDGQSVLISKDKRLDVVPEPSTVVLVSLGLIAFSLQKRRRSA
jgi:hypothetical protein